MATKPKMSSDITIKEKVVKPGYLNNPSDSGVLTITWAPGTNGSEHKISAYRVYWRSNQGQKPTTSTRSGMVEFKVADLTLKNGKYTATINLSQAGKSDTHENQTYSGEYRRGHQIVVGMIAVGGDPNKGSVLASDMVYSNSKCYINDLPKSPSNIIFSRKRLDGNPIQPVAAETTHNTLTRLPYDGGKIAFTGGAPGKDTYTYSNLSIYYSSTPKGDKSKITTSFEKTYTWTNDEKEKEVYFWTYDGLEYSKEPLKFTIEREPKLTFEGQGFNGEEVITTRKNFPAKYVISPRISYSTNKQAQLKATLFISRPGLTARQIEEPINGFNYTDIRKHFTDNELKDGAMYYFKYYFTDGYMDTATTTSQSFYVAPKPKIQEFRDQLCALNNYDYIVETRDTFYRDLTFFIEQDSAWPISKIIAKDSKGNKKTYAIDFSNSDQINLYNNNSLVSYTFRDLIPGEQYEFSLVSPVSNLISNEQNIEFNSYTPLTKIKEPNLSNVSINSFNPSVFKPYSANNDLEVFVNKFTTENNYFLKNWTFQWSSSRAYTSNEFPDAEYSDNFTFKIPAKELSEELISVSTFNKNGRNFIEPTIRLYTAYGNYYEIKGPGLAVDFSEPLNFIGNQTFKVTDKNNNIIDYLKEGAQYSFSGEIESYNGAPYARLLIKYGEKDYVELSSGYKLKDTVGSPKNGEPIKYSYQFDSSVKQIIELYSDATIKVQCSKYSNFENPIEKEFNKTYPAYGHIAPSFLLKSATYDKENEQIKVDFDNVNLGIHKELYQDSTITISILDGPTIPIDDIQSFIENPTASFHYVFDEDKDESVAFVDFRLTVNFTKTPSTSYSNTIQNVSVYNISPTVSYRQNHLSINREYESNNLNDGIIIINDYDKYRKVYLVSQSEKKILSIDVQTGALDGFIINGGTW